MFLILTFGHIFIYLPDKAAAFLHSESVLFFKLKNIYIYICVHCSTEVRIASLKNQSMQTAIFLKKPRSPPRPSPSPLPMVSCDLTDQPISIQTPAAPKAAALQPHGTFLGMVSVCSQQLCMQPGMGTAGLHLSSSCCELSTLVSQLTERSTFFCSFVCFADKGRCRKKKRRNN